MNIISKPVDIDYLRFFTSYCESLRSVSNEEWNYHNVSEAVEYMQSRNDLGPPSEKVIPEEYRRAEYFCTEQDGFVIPPGCMWISKSGRYTGHDIYSITGYQSYILWDLKRRVLLPLVFHDLMGMDEENGILFCRTMSPFHRDGHSSPMAIDLEWIDILGYCISLPKNYPPGEDKSISDEELYVKAGEGVVYVRKENDLFEILKFPHLKDLSINNIRLLDQADSKNSENKNLVGEILFHPDFHLKCEKWVFDAIFAYSEDMEKCYDLASYFGFEDIVDEMYEDWINSQVKDNSKRR